MNVEAMTQLRHVMCDRLIGRIANRSLILLPLNKQAIIEHVVIPSLQ